MPVAGYEIRLRKDGDPWGPWIDVGFVDEYQFTGLEPNTRYYVQTRGYCDTGSISGSSQDTFVTDSIPEVAGFRPFLAYWSGPTSGSPTTSEFGPLSASGERFIWQGGDIKVTVVATTGATASVTTPTGWQHAIGSPFVNIAGNRKINVLWKRIGVNEPLSTVNVADPNAWVMFYVVRGAIETGDPWIDFATAEGTGSSLAFPSVTCEQNSLVLFAGSMTPEVTATTSSYAYNWQNNNLKYITNIDGSDTGNIGHVGTVAIITTAGESGVTTCDLKESLDYALWCGSMKPASIRKPWPVSVGVTSTRNIAGFGRDFSFVPTVIAEESSNYIFAFVETSDAITVNSEWTEAPNSPIINNGGTNPTRLSVFYKKVTDTMDVDVAFNRMGSAFQTGCFVIRGAIATGNPFESISTSTGSGTAITIPGGTTTVNNCLVIQAVARAVSTNNTASYSGWANADLTSVTEQLDRGTTTGDDAGLGVATGIKTVAGAYGTTTATLINNTTWATWQAAIKPQGLTAPTVEASNQIGSSSYPTSSMFNTTNQIAGDLLVAFGASDRLAPDRLVYGEEFGWTFIPTTVSTTGIGVSVAYKRVSGVSPFLDITSTNDHTAISFAVISGLDPDNPIISTESNTGIGTVASIDGDTTTEDNTIVIHAVSSGNESNSQSTTAWTNADLDNLSRGIDRRTTTNNGGYVDSAFGYTNVAKTFGQTTVNLALSDAWAMWRGILKTKP